MKILLGVLLLVMSIFLVIAVLMQNGKSKRLSGSIAGGAETFFGKTKSRTIDAVLSKITTVVAILFILVVIVVYIAFGGSKQEYDFADQLASSSELVDESDEAEHDHEQDEVAEEGDEAVDPSVEGETPVEDGADVADETDAQTPVDEAAHTTDVE